MPQSVYLIGAARTDFKRNLAKEMAVTSIGEPAEVRKLKEEAP